VYWSSKKLHCVYLDREEKGKEVRNLQSIMQQLTWGTGLLINWFKLFLKKIKKKEWSHLLTSPAEERLIYINDHPWLAFLPGCFTILFFILSAIIHDLHETSYFVQTITFIYIILFCSHHPMLFIFCLVTVL
jgi:hypothetical protein